MSGSVERRKPNLRERNKARTRALIQHEAFELFRRQGYAATTVDQIVAAADISESTFFRYFPTKEAVVLSDEFDPVIAAGFRAQPPQVGVVAALRAAIRSAEKAMSADELADVRFRATLIWQVSSLRAAVLEQFTGTLDLIAELVAERLGRRADDPQVRTFAGAVIGISIAVMTGWAEAPDGDLLSSFDRALGFLEGGLSLDG